MSKFVHTIWCDDIRQEVGNKPSFMGVYTGGIVIDQLPAVLPRLCAWTHVSCHIEAPIKKLSISLERDDGTVLIYIPETDFPEPSEDAIQSEKSLQATMFGVQINPLPIPADCKYLHVIVRTEEETLLGNKLWVHANIRVPISPEPDSQVEKSAKVKAQRASRARVKKAPATGSHK